MPEHWQEDYKKIKRRRHLKYFLYITDNHNWYKKAKIIIDNYNNKKF